MSDDDAAPPEGGDEKTAEQIAAEQAQQETEARATRMGWTAQDKFRGDPAKWVDAKTFVERGETLLPVMRERNRALDERLSRTETALSKQSSDFEEMKTRLGEATAAMKQFHEFSRKAEDRSFARAKAELEAKMAQAAASADTNAYHVAKTELDSLDRDRHEATRQPESPEPAKPAAQATQQKTIDPEIPGWIAENSWYERDPIMRAVAQGINQMLLVDRPTMNMRDNLAEVKRIVMERFPEKFNNAKRDEPAAVAATSAPASASRKRGKTFDDIPAADRAPYAEFKRWMPEYTKDEFAKQYFAGDE